MTPMQRREERRGEGPAVFPLLVRGKARRAEDARLLPLVLRSPLSFLAIFRRTARARAGARPHGVVAKATDFPDRYGTQGATLRSMRERSLALTLKRRCL